MATPYGDWPTRPAPHIDKLAHGRQLVSDGTRLAIDVLEGRYRGKGKAWCKIGPDGR